MINMSSLNERLEVLSRCIDYRNLTSASQNVGLSQPQLSRIVRQSEEDLGISLLDRSSPRHSTWTPEARGVVEIYMRSKKSLDSELDAYLDGAVQKEVKIGCLEGLVGLGVEAAAVLLKNTYIEKVTFNLYDLNQLEAKFLSRDLDLAFTSRSPGSQKLMFEKQVGYQTLDKIKTQNSEVKVLSSFEDLSSLKKTKNKVHKKLVSNSLAVRRGFQEKHGGEVLLPSEVMKKPTKSSVPVLLIGQEHISENIWKALSKTN